MAEYGIGGGLNTFVPTFSPATGMIQVEFTRKVNRFAQTRYVQMVKIEQEAGYYLRIDEEEAIRVVNTQDFIWPKGEDRPTGINVDIEWTPFRTARYAFPFSVPIETSEQSQFNVIATHSRVKAVTAMTHRAIRAMSLLTTSGNWPTGTTVADVDTLTGLSGKAWQDSSVADGIIQLSFQTIIEAIIKNSAGAVNPATDCMCVIDPTIAHNVSRAPETKEYVKYFQAATNFYQGDGQFATYGIPSQLFGIGMVVEDAVKNTNRKGATKATNFLVGNGALFLSRPGGLMGAEGPNFSTCVLFAYENMTVETITDAWNRRIRGSVVDNSVFVLTAPLSGYFLQSTIT